jgi:hypothetical protein
MELYQIFIRILKNLGCYVEYVNNFKKLPRYTSNYAKGISFKDFIIKLQKVRLFNYEIFSGFINDSFDWYKTPQGFDYWSNVYREFTNLCREYKGKREYTSSLDEETKKIVFKYFDLNGSLD